MQFLNKITAFLSDTTKIMGGLLGLAIFAELLFGSFLGNFSVIGNIIEIVKNFGDNGFVGLLAMLLIIGFMNKDK